MTQEDKQLLLADTCARLPYGVKIQRINEPESAYRLYSIDTNSGELKFVTFEGDSLSICAGGYLARVGKLRFKPYLRPLLSMTEKERKEYQSLCEVYIDRDTDDNITYYYFDTVESLDWLNKKMFDYRGLIPKGLAISTEEFNPYKY